MTHGAAQLFGEGGSTGVWMAERCNAGAGGAESLPLQGGNMAGRSPQSFKKRQKEQERREKQEEKRAKRLLKKHAGKQPEGEGESPSEETTAGGPVEES
jgi:hypothetical protein